MGKADDEYDEYDEYDEDDICGDCGDPLQEGLHWPDPRFAGEEQRVCPNCIDQAYEEAIEQHQLEIELWRKELAEITRVIKEKETCQSVKPVASKSRPSSGTSKASSPE